MGQLAFIQMFMLVSLPIDINDNRRHVHVFRKGGRHLHSDAKIWIEKNGIPCVEIAESKLTSKDNRLLVEAISKNWDLINSQISKTFKGEKTIIKNLG